MHLHAILIWIDRVVCTLHDNVVRQQCHLGSDVDLAVVTESGEPVGRVCAVENYGATDIIEIEKADGAKFMVPLTKQAVPGWDDARLTLNADFVD